MVRMEEEKNSLVKIIYSEREKYHENIQKLVQFYTNTLT